MNSESHINMGTQAMKISHKYGNRRYGNFLLRMGAGYFTLNMVGGGSSQRSFTLSIWLSFRIFSVGKIYYHANFYCLTNFFILLGQNSRRDSLSEVEPSTPLWKKVRACPLIFQNETHRSNNGPVLLIL